MNKSTSSLLQIVLLVWAVGASVTSAHFYVQNDTNSRALASYQSNTIMVNVGFNYGNGTVEWRNGTILANESTAFDALVATVPDLNYTTSTYGIYIEGINGVQNETHYWAIYLNGEYAIVGVLDLYLVQGDVLFFNFEVIFW